MIISQKTQTLSYSEDIDDLLCEIDVKLSRLARKKLDGQRFGFKTCINTDDFKLLGKYRSIVENKANNYCCYQDFLIDDIISRVKQLLNRN